MTEKREIKVIVEVQDDGTSSQVILQSYASSRDQLLAGLYLLENAIIDIHKENDGDCPTTDFIGRAINSLIREKNKKDKK